MMAISFNIYPKDITTLFLVFAVTISPSVTTTLSLSPSESPFSPSASIASSIVFPRSCSIGFSEYCGTDIYGNMLFGDHPDLEPVCCLELITAGVKCHRALVKLALKLPLPNVNKRKALKLSREQWDSCLPYGDLLGW
ncbi:hypothetical protein ACFX2J_015069 [Malus domestica]|uniref:Prolamin-like domain-containing protein n=1 Tax=Malus baccata TaxID=106549 RepID=A0A540M3W0_MALBA|nr:hypothetical protein C1H46_021195 [Malus baccata]